MKTTCSKCGTEIEASENEIRNAGATGILCQSCIVADSVDTINTRRQMREDVKKLPKDSNN